jgi:hypothetical protein
LTKSLGMSASSWNASDMLAVVGDGLKGAEIQKNKWMSEAVIRTTGMVDFMVVDHKTAL